MTRFRLLIHQAVPSVDCGAIKEMSMPGASRGIHHDCTCKGSETSLNNIVAALFNGLNNFCPASDLKSATTTFALPRCKQLGSCPSDAGAPPVKSQLCL
jgi:hypothetical protein